MDNLTGLTGATPSSYTLSSSSCGWYTTCSTPQTKISIDLEIDSNPDILLILDKLKKKLINKGFKINNIDIY